MRKVLGNFKLNLRKVCRKSAKNFKINLDNVWKENLRILESVQSITHGKQYFFEKVLLIKFYKKVEQSQKFLKNFNKFLGKLKKILIKW